MQTVLAKRFLVVVTLLVSLVLASERAARAQMIVSDPETEYETAQTALQTYESYLQAAQQFQMDIRNLSLGQMLNYSNFQGDLSSLVAALQTSPSGGDTNSLSVENAALPQDFSNSYGGYTPQTSDAGEQQFATLVRNQLGSIVQAMQTNQVAFQRSQTDAQMIGMYQSQNNSAAGTNQLLQTTNGLLTEVLKELTFEEAANATRMQAILAVDAGKTQSEADAYSYESQHIQAEENVDSQETASIAW